MESLLIIMIGVILAAGRGTRMGGIETPKCLLELGSTSIIKYQIKCLQNNGIKNILVITGHKSEMIQQHLGNIVQYKHLKNFANVNNLYSIWESRDFIDDDFICMYSDLFFHPEILKKCINCKNNVCLVVEPNTRGETMRVKIDNNKIIQVNKTIPLKESNGNFIGMSKFSFESSKFLFNEISNLIKEKNFDAYYTLAIEEMIKHNHEIGFVKTNNLPWMDIDEPNELIDAQKIYSKILENE